MKFLFKKQSKEVEKLQEEVNRLNHQLYYNEKNDINDFISVLEQIQETIDIPMQWKKKITTLDNITKLSIQSYRDKIMELDINA